MDAEYNIWRYNIKRPDMVNLEARLKSYENKRWEEAKCAKTKQELAEAGFYYAGYGDCVRCFSCAGGIKNWEPEDEPWVEHARWFAQTHHQTRQCTYVYLVKGPIFIDIVQRKNRLKEKILMKDVKNEILKVKKPPTKKEEASPVLRENDDLTSLLKKIKRLELENNTLEEEKLCTVCLCEPRCVAFLQCGHVVTCGECAAKLKNCVLCRSEIRGTITIADY